MTWRRVPEDGLVVVVAHREVLCVVVVDLVARKGLGAVDPRGVGRVGVVREQLVVQAVYRRSISESLELRLPRRVLGVRVGTEVVVEGAVLLVDDDHVLDRGGRGSTLAL